MSVHTRLAWAQWIRTHAVHPAALSHLIPLLRNSGSCPYSLSHTPCWSTSAPPEHLAEWQRSLPVVDGAAQVLHHELLHDEHGGGLQVAAKAEGAGWGGQKGT